MKLVGKFFLIMIINASVFLQNSFIFRSVQKNLGIGATAPAAPPSYACGFPKVRLCHDLKLSLASGHCLYWNR